jgi:outer membrane biosynthesis protein TonB
MKVKIMDIDLIRRFNGVIVDMDNNLAIRMKREGKVKIIGEEEEYTFPDIDTSTVIDFNEPTVKVEKKVNKIKEKIEAKKKDKENRIPAPNDPIFPQIKGGRK